LAIYDRLARTELERINLERSIGDFDCAVYLVVDVLGKVDGDVPTAEWRRGRRSFVQSFLNQLIPFTIREFLSFA
jgi:hypothetical protein